MSNHHRRQVFQQSMQYIIKNSLCHIFEFMYENYNLLHIQFYDKDGTLDCDF